MINSAALPDRRSPCLINHVPILIKRARAVPTRRHNRLELKYIGDLICRVQRVADQHARCARNAGAARRPLAFSHLNKRAIGGRSWRSARVSRIRAIIIKTESASLNTLVIYRRLTELQLSSRLSPPPTPGRPTDRCVAAFVNYGDGITANIANGYSVITGSTQVHRYGLFHELANA